MLQRCVTDGRSGLCFPEGGTGVAEGSGFAEDGSEFPVEMFNLGLCAEGGAAAGHKLGGVEHEHDVVRLSRSLVMAQDPQALLEIAAIGAEPQGIAPLGVDQGPGHIFRRRGIRQIELVVEIDTDGVLLDRGARDPVRAVGSAAVVGAFASLGAAGMTGPIHARGDGAVCPVAVFIQQAEIGFVGGPAASPMGDGFLPEAELYSLRQEGNFFLHPIFRIFNEIGSAGILSGGEWIADRWRIPGMKVHAYFAEPQGLLISGKVPEKGVADHLEIAQIGGL